METSATVAIGASNNRTAEDARARQTFPSCVPKPFGYANAGAGGMPGQMEAGKYTSYRYGDTRDFAVQASQRVDAYN